MKKLLLLVLLSLSGWAFSASADDCTESFTDSVGDVWSVDLCSMRSGNPNSPETVFTGNLPEVVVTTRLKTRKLIAPQMMAPKVAVKGERFTIAFNCDTWEFSVRSTSYLDSNGQLISGMGLDRRGAVFGTMFGIMSAQQPAARTPMNLVLEEACGFNRPDDI